MEERRAVDTAHLIHKGQAREDLPLLHDSFALLKTPNLVQCGLEPFGGQRQEGKAVYTKLVKTLRSEIPARRPG